MAEMLGRDMKWPHCKGSLVPENVWNTGLSDLMDILSDAQPDSFWCCDTDLKYLTIRIDTRDNAFLLYVDGPDGEKVRIDPQRVPDAIEKWRDMAEGYRKRGRAQPE